MATLLSQNLLPYSLARLYVCLVHECFVCPFCVCCFCMFVTVSPFVLGTDSAYIVHRINNTFLEALESDLDFSL